MAATKKYLFTFKKVIDGKIEKIELTIEAKHKEEARAKFKERCGAFIPLNYRFKEVKGNVKG